MREKWSLNDALDAAETAAVSAQATAEQQLEEGAARLIEVEGERDQLQNRVNVGTAAGLPVVYCV